MSRIGKLPIEIPAQVEITIDKKNITVKGPKGELHYVAPEEISVNVKDNILNVERKDDSRESKSYHGLVRSLISNMIKGVLEGYEKKLEVIGVGYRAEVKGKELVMQLGFSHPIHFQIPEGIKIEVNKEKNDVITIQGIDKALVGQVAANIRTFRPPEPYKGKGIRYIDSRDFPGEHVVRKEGKRVGE